MFNYGQSSFQYPSRPAYTPYQPPQQSGGMIWVSGEQEAYAYMMAPNSAAALWDSTRPAIYLKQTDAAGRPSLKTYDLVERALASPAVPQQQPQADYVTRSEFEALAARLDALTKKEAEDE